MHQSGPAARLGTRNLGRRAVFLKVGPGLRAAEMEMTMAGSDTPKAGQVQGEGDYVSAKRYDDAQQAFAKDEGKVHKKAKEAEAALDGPEGAELERARRESAKGDPKRH
jgi:hypothetical protein